MQGGAPNNANPYGSYQAGAGAGGYAPQQAPQQQQQQQQPQQGYAAAAAARGGYYQPQQAPAAQQQYAGYPAQAYGQAQIYGQGYAPRGGYQQPQQAGYVPRGGYYQGAGAQQGYAAAGATAVAAAQQQAYAAPQQGAYGATAGRGGYGYSQGYNQGYYLQQQQHGYYDQGYNQYAEMQRGGYQGGAYRGQQPYNPQGGRGGVRGGYGGYGGYDNYQGGFQRGGRGGGRGMRGGRGGMGGRLNETYAVVHLDTYAQLEEAGRKGSTEAVLSPELLTDIKARSRGGPIKLLVVIQKKYAAACLTIPRHSDDPLLSEKTAEAFLQVPCVTANRAKRLVEMENGSFIQGAVYNIFRSLMMTLTAFDKPRPAAPAEGQPQPADVHERPTEELVEAITKDVATYEAVLTAMSADSDESTKLFQRLMRFDKDEEAGEGEGDGDEDGEENGAEDGGHTGEAKAVEKASASASATPSVPPKRPHTLLMSPQGIRILRAALAVSSKRQVFFEKLTPPPAKAEVDPLARMEWSASLSLLSPLFQYPLLSDLLFHFFGLVPAGTQDVKVPKAKATEVKVLCDGLARYGVFLGNTAAGGNTILSLLHAADPHRALATDASPARNPGQKRTRDGDDEAAESAQKTKVEEEAKEVSAPDAPAQLHAPASLAEYKGPTAPADWHLFYALAAALCTGELPATRRKRNRFNAPEQQQQVEAEQPPQPATVAARIRHVSHTVTGSYLVRYLVPIFADAILASLKSPAARKKKEHAEFVQHCETVLTTMATSWTTADPLNTDGYVYRFFLADLAARAVPGTPVEAAFRSLTERIVNTIYESAREKYHSHCVQEALTVARQTKEGGQFVLQVARALLEKGVEALLSLSLSPSGNYVVRDVCTQLTDYASGKVAGAEVEVPAEATELEGKFFKFVGDHQQRFSHVAYGRGLVTWHGEQMGRLAKPASKPATPPAAAPAAAPATDVPQSDAPAAPQPL